MRPVARTTGLVIRDLGDETVVYDLERHQAHCLNRTAALVFRHADGRRSVAEIAVAVAAEAHSPVDEDVVQSAIQKLAEARLIENVHAKPSPPPATRREALRKVGLGAALLAPVVASLLVPTPAEAAATCVPAASCTLAKFGDPCWSGSQAECTSKICTDNGVCQ
jgi:hypothetical protein